MITELLIVFCNSEESNSFYQKNGFIHEEFNLCCKYDVIHFWHGKIQGLNPKSHIKNKILAFSLMNDLNIGRKRACAFTNIFLFSIFLFQKSQHLVEPFLEQDFLSSASTRCFVTKFLLQSRVFSRKCFFALLIVKIFILINYFFVDDLKDKTA